MEKCLKLENSPQIISDLKLFYYFFFEFSAFLRLQKKMMIFEFFPTVKIQTWKTECDDKLKLGFQRDRVDDRKTWLTEYMEDLARRQQNEEPELTLYDREQIPYVTYQDFIDKELVLFSYASLQRAIPNCIDGFKPGQRKAWFIKVSL